MIALNNYIQQSRILYYCKIDLAGNYTYVSPYFEEVFDCKAEDMIGVNSLDTIYHEDHQKTREVSIKCFQNPNTYQQIILRKPLKNGTIVWTQWEFYLTTDENNQPKEILCYGYDQSKKIENLRLLNKANKKLVHNEVKYKTLFETSSLGIILHSPDGTLYDVNEAFCRMVDIHREEILKYNIAEFTPEEYWEKDKAFIKDLVSRNASYTYEKEFLNNKSNKVSVAINGKTFLDQTGDVLIWCIAKDITDFKQQEKQLSIQKELLEQTAHIAKLGGWEIDIKTFKTKWTKEVYEIHDMEEGYDHNLEKGISFYHPDDQETVSNAVNKAINEGIKFDLEARFISAKNNHKWLRVIGEPIYQDNKIVSVKGVLQDISRRKKAEETISKQNDLLKDISYTQSHTVRLPIANIMGLIDLADLTLDADERHEIYQKIKHSVNQLDTIVRDLTNKKITD